MNSPKYKPEWPLTRIAAALQAAAINYPLEVTVDKPKPQLILTCGTLRLSCVPTFEAVHRMAKKFQQKTFAWHRTTHNALLPKHSMRRLPDADARLAKVLGELGELGA